MSGALDFLSPGLARDDNGFHPVARSALERLYRAAGATFEERDRWLVATAVPGEADRLRHVGIADLSHLGKLDVRPAPPDVDGATTYRLSPRRALVLFPAAGADEGGERPLGSDARGRCHRGVRRARRDRPRGACAPRTAHASPRLPVRR